MDLTVSRPVKILALILVIAGVGGIASLSLLGKSTAASGPKLSVAQIRARAHQAAGGATTTPTAAKGHAKATATTTPAAPAKTHTTALKPPPPVQVKAPAVRKPVVTTAADGLPIVLADALRSHQVVVISVFDPQSQTDAVSYAEARAGAAAAHAGFLGVNVLDDTVAGPLTAVLPGGGLLPLPGVLVYRAPGTLVERVDGFADRDSVAALALSGRTAPALTGAPASTTAPAGAPAAPAPAATAPATTTP